MPHRASSPAAAPDSAITTPATSEDGDEPRRSRGTGLNRVQLIGRLVRDVELRYTAQGTPVANMRVATNDRDQAEFHDCVVWRATAEFASTYLRRGRLVYVEGRLHGESWTDRDSNTRYSVRVVTERLLALDRAQGSDAPGDAEGGEE